MPAIGIICVGDELLDGRVTEANAAWLAGALQQRGEQLATIRVVADDRQAICEALADEATRCDLLVVSGGLGPTADDITREAAADWAGVGMTLHDDVLAQLEERFASRGYTFTANNRRQCVFPEGADVLATEVGTAAGFRLRVGATTALFFPGVPAEFTWFAERYLLDRFDPDTSARRRQLTFFGLGESQLEHRLDDIEAVARQAGVRIGYRASYPVIEVTLKARSDESLEQLSRHVLDRIGAWLVSVDEQTLPSRLGLRLCEAGQRVSVVESCTAGLLGATMTEVAGSSGWFDGGFITYANDAKRRFTGVRPAVLTAHGAVSPQVVCQMAAGCRRETGTDWALAISGIAGPGGGTSDKPVGTVEFGLAGPAGVWRRRSQFPNRGRQPIRVASVYTAMSLLLWALEDRLDDHRLDGPFDDAAVWSADGVALDD